MNLHQLCAGMHSCQEQLQRLSIFERQQHQTNAVTPQYADLLAEARAVNNRQLLYFGKCLSFQPAANDTNEVVNS